MSKKTDNPNDHKRVTPSTKGEESDDKKFTSYDTSKKETASPQKARESREASSEQAQQKGSKGKTE